MAYSAAPSAESVSEPDAAHTFACTQLLSRRLSPQADNPGSTRSPNSTPCQAPGVPTGPWPMRERRPICCCTRSALRVALQRAARCELERCVEREMAVAC